MSMEFHNEQGRLYAPSFADPTEAARNGEQQPLLSLTSKAPKLKLEADESVYGAILLLPAISRLTEKTRSSWNRPARLAILLCIMNALLQLGVVRVLQIYGHADRLTRLQQILPPDEVIEEGDDPFANAEKDTVDSIRKTHDETHRSFLPPNEKEELAAAEEIEPLCKRIGHSGTFTCMPHSVKFAFDWDKLDTDGDGVWSHAEAVADASNLRAKRGISPETIFNNLINGLRFHSEFVRHSGHNRTFYLSPDVENEQNIPKAYFNFWKGDAMMCAHFDSNSCEAAAKAGVFNEALKPGRLSARAKGIHDLDSAIQYCYRMLQDGGGCEALLPTDFKRNREQRWGRCGSRSLTDGGKFTNPYDSDQSVHILEATYKSVNSYTRATSRLYQVFLSLVIMCWLLALLDEWRELLKFGEFLIVFPRLQPGMDGGSVTALPEDDDSEPDESFKITAISKAHHAVLILFYIIRVLVCMILTLFGTTFLLEETDFLSLVMNSLALTFILTIDSMLFGLMEHSVQDKMSNCKPLEFVTRLPTKGCAGYCLKKECWGLFLVPLLAISIVIWWTLQQREPILTVLRCACTQEGAKCLDSVQYQAQWWKEYWSKVLPAAVHQIEALRIAGE